MSSASHVPSVEERLRSALALCAVLRPLVQLADCPLPSAPGFSANEVLRLVPGLADTIAAHAEAIKRALPASCQNIVAPDWNGAQ